MDMTETNEQRFSSNLHFFITLTTAAVTTHNLLDRPSRLRPQERYAQRVGGSLVYLCRPHPQEHAAEEEKQKGRVRLDDLDLFLSNCRCIWVSSSRVLRIDRRRSSLPSRFRMNNGVVLNPDTSKELSYSSPKRRRSITAQKIETFTFTDAFRFTTTGMTGWRRRSKRDRSSAQAWPDSGERRRFGGGHFL
ncbi:hypothetical protein ACLB2K_022098 [Fragaria x ananassa]